MTLRPGQYQFVADPNSDEVRVERGGKLIGTVAGKAVTLNQKSEYTAIIFNGSRISEIQFMGKVEAIKID
ncbi:MAG: hypothetical protein WBE20_03115 [Candidatus Acidiferrales bacterium]